MSKKKPPGEKSVSVAVSLPQWMWDAIDAKSESGSVTNGRSAIIRAVLEKQIALVEGRGGGKEPPLPGKKEGAKLKLHRKPSNSSKNERVA